MKKTVIILLLLSINLAQSQDYFTGKRRYCGTNDERTLYLFDLGIRCFQYPDHYKSATRIFTDLIKKDSTFCDAYFFAGYSLRIQNKINDALAYYYMADSLANNKSLEFKVNLASTALMVGADTLSRKKYNEIIKYFPESAEGYYGYALTSPIIGDVDKGLDNINIVIEKKENLNASINDDVYFLKGILLALNKKYEEGIEYLDKISSTYKKDENFKIHYALCLLKVSEIKNNEKLKQKALKFYEKIEHKDQIPENLKSLLKF